MSLPRNPYPTVDVVIEVEGGVVLVERANPPRGWALPGGFIDYGESPEDAARREALEETGLTVELLALLGVYGAPRRDPRQHNLSITYVGRAEGVPAGGDDAARARVWSLDDLPALCFDHAAILDDYRAWRRGDRPLGPTPPRGPLLLALARDAVEAAVTAREPRSTEAERYPFARVPGAAFVTLRRPDGSVRGCVGELLARQPLAASVRRSATRAALRDPRFAPVQREELPGLRVEVSVLGPPRITAPDEIEVGRHGVVLALDGQRAVLLPEVARDAGWDRAGLLGAVCRKAGLPERAWEDPRADLQRFETEKFASDEPGPQPP